MLTSNILSRVIPARSTGRSVYEELRINDGDGSDIETQAGLALDEENLRFHDNELGYPEIPGSQCSRMTTKSPDFFSHQHDSMKKESSFKGKDNIRHPQWMNQSPRLLSAEDADDDVPASLLIEENEVSGLSATNNPRTIQPDIPNPILPKNTHGQWGGFQDHLNLHRVENDSSGKPPLNRRVFGMVTGNARERALWRWINITNLDNFISDVYDYYTGAGIWCILLEGALNLIQVIFVAVFTTFLTKCVNFQKISTSKKLTETLVPQCTKKISGLSNLAVWLFALHVFWRVYQLLSDIPRLLRIREFYLYLLEIPESDMQTISWQDVVARIMALRDANPITAEEISPSNRKFLGSQSKQRLDAHDIANRLMRKENYLIALFNKDILDLTLPIPFLRGRQLFSRTLLWNIDQCIMDLVFNDKGQVRQVILKESHRKKLSDALRGRFMFAGFMNAWLAPIIVIYLMIVYFLRYFNEYQKNPAAVGSRQYTPLAVWKFREFNELQHLFDKRINMSYPFASRYLDQFPKIKMIQLARFLAFCAGAIVSVLALITLWDPEMLTNFEITSDRPVVFYIGVFGAIWALTNGMIPEDNLVFDPEYALRNVIDYTHYMPNHWHNRLHSDDVKREFATLYKLKIVIFFEEVFSIIVTPFILWLSLPKCSDQIIDFFREFTIHVDGVGYVCSFAVFDFKKGYSRKIQDQTIEAADIRDDYYSTKHGKMTASYYGFIDNYLLNPKTGVQGHIPPGTRQNYYPPPSFPGLQSPALAPNTNNSRIGRSKKRPESRTSRLAPENTRAISPMQSILLDPHHQPSNSGFGRLTSRSRYQARHEILEEPTENDNDLDYETQRKNSATHRYESATTTELDESRWETSPKVTALDNENEDVDSNDAGVLGLLYQFQKVRKDGRGGGVNI